MANYNLKIDDVALDHFLNDPRGTVGKWMYRKIGIPIQQGAKRMVGREAGLLRRRINIVHKRRGRQQTLTVIGDTSYGFMHHEGTRPHQIRPNNGRILRFKVAGRVVYARKVNHPGTRPVKYLTVPMKTVVRGTRGR